MMSTSPEPETNAPKRLSREVKARIRRRANALSSVAYDRYVSALECEVRSEAVLPLNIETWTPPELVTTK